MNNGIGVSAWQDALMTRPTPLPVREVDDIDTLKALSDPTRLKILRALMSGPKQDPRVMSAKELADELAEPQTKLYRHIKQLEARQLIQVAETRLVSGIVEHRYQTGQLTIDMSRDFLSGQAPDDTTTAFTALLGNFVTDFTGAIESGRIRFDEEIPDEESYRKPVLNGSIVTVSREKANEYRARLAALIDDILAEDEPADGVTLSLLTVFYSPE